MTQGYHNIPEELCSLPNWVTWRLEKRTDKSGVVCDTKVPYNAKTGKHAKSNVPTTWSTFTEALEALKSGVYDGIGLCLSPPYVGVDLDGCRQENGSTERWAQQILDELASYSELSPSGCGIHVIVRGELPDGRRQWDFKDRPHHGLGLYDAARGRYLTMTGLPLNGSAVSERTAELREIHARFSASKPKAKEAAAGDDDLISRAQRANDGGKFTRLWNGQWEGEYASQSEADLALCMKLAFWTSRDASRIDALFRRSGLMRDKWNREDYRKQTIAAAIERTKETWQPRSAGRHSATINIDAVTPNIELLNACDVLAGKVRFTNIERRGPMIVARFAESNVEAVWPSMQDLISFQKSQAILAESTQVLIPTPSRKAAKTLWEPAAQLILRLAGTSDITSMDSLRDEFQHIILSTWKRAECPFAPDDDVFFDILRECLEHRRDPQALKPPRTCVWHDNRSCYVHQPSLIEWLSTPSARNKHYDWSEVRKALLLLKFKRDEVHRSLENKSVKVRLWRGPLELLVEDET